MPLAQTFETTIFNADIRKAAEVFVLPRRTLDAMPDRPDSVDDLLGLRLGVPVPSAVELPSVFFAAMAGRVVPFDEGSFERWQRQMEEGDLAEFARDLAFCDVIPVETSPLATVSAASLTARGPAWVVAGSQMWAEHPFQALGVVIAGEFGAVVVDVVRAFGQSAAAAAKYHTRRGSESRRTGFHLRIVDRRTAPGSGRAPSSTVAQVIDSFSGSSVFLGAGSQPALLDVGHGRESGEAI